MRSVHLSPMLELALLGRGTRTRLVGPGTVLRQGDAPRLRPGSWLGGLRRPHGHKSAARFSDPDPVTPAMQVPGAEGVAGQERR